jgi:adenylate cyclase
VRVLSTSSTLADSNEGTEAGRGIPLLKTALLELPQMDSIYVAYDTGGWLQAMRVSDVEYERERLRAPPQAVFASNFVRPTPSGALPMRRIFEDQQGNQIAQLNLWKYGYDARTRPWYIDTMEADRLLISRPYIAFTTGAPVITVSTPLRGTVRGIIAADLKLDDFSNFVYANRPGEHGTALVFDTGGKLFAHPDLTQFVASALTHPLHAQLPSIAEIHGGPAAAVLKGWSGGDQYDGSVRDEAGEDYLFRLRKFALDEHSSGYVLLLAAQNDFIQGVRGLQLVAMILATIASATFIPAVWIFGSRMSRALNKITAQAGRLRILATPDHSPVASYIKEIHELGTTVNLAQRAISSFARFVPREIVKRVIDNSISTELGEARQEITALFTDIRGFTTISESVDPDTLMHQTSRYFTVLTEAFLAEGGTVDKFIGDAVMVFWNAPNPQSDHIERACRAALAGKLAGERLNARFEAEGLPTFHTRFGIHVGQAVVGNLGSAERMNYTALGNTVNLASRLEGLNKQYGTVILVSEEVHSRVASRLRFRAVDSVIAKGMTKKTCIFELVETSDEDMVAEVSLP